MNETFETSIIEILKAQRDLAIKINSANTFNELLDFCLDSAIMISGMDSGGIYLVDKVTGDVNLKSYKGLSEEFISSGIQHKSGSPQVELIMEGDPVYIISTNINTLLDDIQKEEGLKSLAILPVKNNDDVIACINIASHVKSEIHKSLILPLETMLTVIGNAIAKFLSEKALKQSEEKFSIAFNSSSSLIAISEMDTGKFIEVNETFLNVLGFKKDDVIGKTAQELKIFDNPDLKNIMINMIQNDRKIRNLDIEITTTEKKKLVGIFNVDIIKIGNETFLLTVMQDITQRKNDEIKLQQSLDEKEILLKEIHHRVKNNLQIISSLLDLQANTYNDEKFRNAIQYSQGRIKSMALVHELLYTSSNLSIINSKDYLISLVQEISKYCSNHYFKIKFKYDIDDMDIDLSSAIPYALIINELITNCFQHAFTESDEGLIEISFKDRGKNKQLCVKDNGKGIDKDLDILSQNSLGLKLVKILVNQINGDIEINNIDGTEFVINFEL